jgi:hypothetical protein
MTTTTRTRSMANQQLVDCCCRSFFLRKRAKSRPVVVTRVEQNAERAGDENDGNSRSKRQVFQVVIVVFHHTNNINRSNEASSSTSSSSSSSTSTSASASSSLSSTSHSTSAKSKALDESSSGVASEMPMIVSMTCHSMRLALMQENAGSLL